MAESEGKSFRVQDRRRFDAEGNLKPEEPTEPTAEGAREAARDSDPESPRVGPVEPGAEPPEAERAKAASPSERAEGSAAQSAARPPPAEESGQGADEVGFTELVLSIATNALAFLGRDDPGDSGTVSASKVNLKLASQNIDILAMLETKTRGNLTRSESDLLTSVLYDLRTLYVETAKAVGG